MYYVTPVNCLETIGIFAPSAEVVMPVLLFLAAVAAAVIDKSNWGRDGHGVEWLLGGLGRHVDVEEDVC